ncbi:MULTISPECIES: hypothetical protein [unclassified Streptomyces]|uniref:hypothetical protein n=1 Tax=unclassified Streptomyces TaxID=2593676 RepID=UPI00131CA19C|nr:hypothetical protein [Streptomyces sp. CB01635]
MTILQSAAEALVLDGTVEQANIGADHISMWPIETEKRAREIGAAFHAAMHGLQTVAHRRSEPAPKAVAYEAKAAGGVGLGPCFESLGLSVYDRRPQVMRDAAVKGELLVRVPLDDMWTAAGSLGGPLLLS